MNQEVLTQFGKAMQQLGIEMLPAYSSEAKGRSERMFGTMQNRLPQELKLEEIQVMTNATESLKDLTKNAFIPRYFYHREHFFQEDETELELKIQYMLLGIKTGQMACYLNQTFGHANNRGNIICFFAQLLLFKKTQICFVFLQGTRVDDKGFTGIYLQNMIVRAL